MKAARLLIASALLAALPLAAFAESWPSLFRGVVVSNNEIGVKVVSVEPASQAYLADLRPEDVIVRVDEFDVTSIDTFATISSVLKGRMTETTVVVFRNGAPREIRLHLYSYPVLERWGVEFVPDFDLRFAQPQIGFDYWSRMGRGFEEAEKPEDAINAYLNALHAMPEDDAVALKIAEQFSDIGRKHLAENALPPALSSLSSALSILEHLFDKPLNEAQLTRIRTLLEATVSALKQARR